MNDVDNGGVIDDLAGPGIGEGRASVDQVTRRPLGPGSTRPLRLRDPVSTGTSGCEAARMARALPRFRSLIASGRRFLIALSFGRHECLVKATLLNR